MLSRKERQLLDALEPRAAQEKIEIVTVEVVGAKKAPTIRVYIDAEGGVGFDELSSSQAWINAIMDDLDPFPGAYSLEVSSPGIDRPLRTAEHFERFAGEKVQISCSQPIDGRSRFSGVLEGCQDGQVRILVDGDHVAIPLDTIKRAHVVGTVDFSR